MTMMKVAMMVVTVYAPANNIILKMKSSTWCPKTWFTTSHQP